MSDSKWIKTSEQCPNDMQEVIFIVSSTDEHYHRRILGGRYLSDWNEFTTPGMSFGATHWMPMPLLPEGLALDWIYQTPPILNMLDLDLKKLKAISLATQQTHKRLVRFFHL